MEPRILAYTLPNETRHRCVQCTFQFPPRLFDFRTKLCIHCHLNFDLGVIPHPQAGPSAHPNHVQQNNRYCSDCRCFSANNEQQWDYRLDKCRGCARDHAEGLAHRRALATLENEDPERPRITIPIPRRQACTLCGEQFPLSSFKDTAGEVSSRCRSCRKREKCSDCLRRRKRRHFRTNGPGEEETLSQRCDDCRVHRMSHVERRRIAAEAVGKHP
ncbi:hypothetical protein C8R47DRAFT_716093 [Mycena vitilis]|nr:hypothetical protein C8R47DRAFT_716093 [Mycena vitilis]